MEIYHSKWTQELFCLVSMDGGGGVFGQYLRGWGAFETVLAVAEHCLRRQQLLSFTTTCGICLHLSCVCVRASHHIWGGRHLWENLSSYLKRDRSWHKKCRVSWIMLMARGRTRGACSSRCYAGHMVCWYMCRHSRMQLCGKCGDRVERRTPDA